MVMVILWVILYLVQYDLVLDLSSCPMSPQAGAVVQR